MVIMDKILNAMRLNADDEEDYYDDDDFLDEDLEDDDDDESGSFFNVRRRREKRPVREERTVREERRESAPEPERAPRTAAASRTAGKVSSIRSTKRSAGYADGGPNVIMLKPVIIEETRDVADSLRRNKIVILNLDGLDYDIAQRITDFTCGCCYSMGGSIQRISGYIYAVVPSAVGISGDFQDMIEAFFDNSSGQVDI